MPSCKFAIQQVTAIDQKATKGKMTRPVTKRKSMVFEACDSDKKKRPHSLPELPVGWSLRALGD